MAAVTDKKKIALLHFGPVSDIQPLLAEGMNVNTRSTTFANMTPLMSHASQNDLEEVKYLLSKGADPTLQDNNGWTALHHVVYVWNTIPELIEIVFKASPESARVRSATGQTPDDILNELIETSPNEFIKNIFRTKKQIITEPALRKFQQHMLGKLYDPNTESGQRLMAASKKEFEAIASTPSTTPKQGGRRSAAKKGKRTKKRNPTKKQKKNK